MGGVWPACGAATASHRPPAALPLDAYLNDRYGPQVVRVIRAMQAQHEAMHHPNRPVHVNDRMVVLASTADKVVAQSPLLRRG